MWLFSLMELYYIRSSKDRDIPWGFLNVSKLVINVGLILLSTADAIMAVTHDNATISSVHLYSPIIKIATFVSTTLILFDLIQCEL